MEATLSKNCNGVKDANDFVAAGKTWLEEQIHVAARNLSNRPSERRGPFEISDELIEDLTEQFSLKSQ